MDDLVSEFVIETLENLSVLDQELVRFEQSPRDKDILSNIFRMMHTIKGTCGFLGLPRLEKVAHAGEDVLGKFRDGALAPTPVSVTLILKCIDQIRGIVEHLGTHGVEGDGNDNELIASLKALLEKDAAPQSGPVLSPQGFPVALELLSEVESAAGQSDVSHQNAAVAVQEPVAPPIGPAPLMSEQGFPVAAELLAEIASHLQPSPAEQKAEVPRAAEKTPDKTPDKSDAGKEKGVAQTIRVNVEVLENLMTLVSEMVLTRNQLLQLARSNEDSTFKEPIERLSRTTSELQEGVMKTRMQPIGNAWGKLPRIVRDLANELGKKINLVMHGEETELDRQVLELIQDPLTHMVRNSADHGIEQPADREASGKEATGTIRLSAFHEGGHIIIEISDDGRGINTAKVRGKIIERGLATEEELASMDDATVNQYIMRAGFSTAEKITKVSGRGVGMDVVRANIEKIGGIIEFRSAFGAGSTFTIKIPLTLAIISSLIVECGTEKFALPQISVNEVVRISERSEHRIEALKGAPILRLRNRLLPLVNLSELLDLEDNGQRWSPARNTYEGYVVVCDNGSHAMGVIVDGIADAEEIVVKPLSKILGGPKYFSGNTILGDGRVVLILDINGLSSSLSLDAVQAQVTDKAVEAVAPTDSILLFHTQQPGLKAVALGAVQRIENFDMTTVEFVQGDAVVQYRGTLLPLLSMDGDFGIRREGRQQVLVFSREGRSVGLAIDAIVDIVQDNIAYQKVSRAQGLFGSAIIAGKAVDVIDTAYFLDQVADMTPTNAIGAAA